jgi:hypothetical protein
MAALEAAIQWQATMRWQMDGRVRPGHDVGRHTASALDVLAILAVAFGLLAPAAAQGMPPLASGPGERILAFDADITVAGNGDVHVVESMKVKVEGERIQRGIIRNLPLDGAAYDVLSVTRDGHDEPFTADTRGAVLEIRIGSPDVLLQPGEATYQIAYRATEQVRTSDGVNALAWSVTGHDWAFGIDSAAASIHLPAGATATNLRLLTGPPGSTASEGTIAQDGTGAIRAHAPHPLQPGNGMTVVIEWPAPAQPEPGRTLDGIIRFYTIIGYVFVLPLIVLAL